MPKLHRRLTRHRDTLWVPPRTVLADLHRAAWASYPDETGGVLLGHRQPGDGLGATVRYLVGPGPAAIHEPRRFEPDYAWQAAATAELWTTDQSLEYLGDWHTHPGGTTALSQLDKDALRAIAAAPDANQGNPVMLIVGLHPDCARLGATVLSGGALKPLRVAVQGGSGRFGATSTGGV
jgi:integrative and conjugative element protein (TIGR02256 family)